MAHVETWYRCPVCDRAFDDYIEAVRCRNLHNICSERWAVGYGGKSVRIFENCAPNCFGGEEWALREADLSDKIEERNRQLKMMEAH